MRADRLLTLVMLLQTRGKMTAQALADELGVSRRTILRDIDALSLAGVPVYADGGHGGGIALDEAYRMNWTGIQEEEARTLFLSSNTRLLNDVGLGEAAERSALKLLSVLPARYQPSVEFIRQRLLIDPTWWWHDPPPESVWPLLQTAVYEDRRLQAVYEHPNGTTATPVLEPYGLVAKSSVWYLVAKRETDFRTYRVSRFRSVTLLPERFERDADFNLPSFWQYHLTEFVATAPEYVFALRIHPERVDFARGLAPGRSDVLSEEDDGWITVEFRFESMDLARMLALGLGTQAQVIKPVELHEAVVKMARAICDRGD